LRQAKLYIIAVLREPMAEKSGLDRAIAYFGVGASVVGILFALWSFFLFNGLLDAVHEAGVGQVDAVISMMGDTLVIVNSTANSMDSFSEAAADGAATMGYSAEAVGSLAEAVEGLAASLGSIPLMPSGATASLYSTASEMRASADSMEETAGSMGGFSGEALSATLGVQALEEDIAQSILELEQAKKKLDEIHFTAKSGLVLGTLLLVLLFALNGLSFYRQAKG
jgi:hypothetical protein